MQNQGYNPSHQPRYGTLGMPKQEFDALTDFGKRLVNLRKKAGYTQTELAKELGVTQRMVSYYEGHSDYPPSNLLPKLAEVLNVTTDELLGVKPLKKNRLPDTRLSRRVQQLEKLDTATRRQVIQVIDTFIENAKLKQQAS